MMNTNTALDRPIELKFSIWGAGPEVEMTLIWIDEVEKRTSGRLHFIRYYRSEPAIKEKADAFNDCPAFGGRYHLLDMIQTPFVIPSSVVGSKVIAQLYAEFPEFREELSDVKIVGLGTGALMGIFASRAWGAVRRVEDLKGAKTRSLLPIDKAIEALGAKPMHVNFLEIGELLKTGGLDLAVFGIGLAKARQWADHAPYCTVSPGPSISMHPMRTFMTWEAWNLLPPDIQKIIDGLGPAGSDCWFAAQNAITFDASLPPAREYIKQCGGEIITLTAKEFGRWLKLIKPLRESVVDAAEGKGLPARRFFSRMLELVERYSQ